MAPWRSAAPRPRRCGPGSSSCCRRVRGPEHGGGEGPWLDPGPSRPAARRTRTATPGPLRWRSCH